MCAPLQVGPKVQDPRDFTDTLQLDKKRIIGNGSFSTVYRCLRT